MTLEVLGKATYSPPLPMLLTTGWQPEPCLDNSAVVQRPLSAKRAVDRTPSALDDSCTWRIDAEKS